MKAIAIAAALLAFTACSNSTAPAANDTETAALKARVEKLESELAQFKAQFFNEAPITNSDGTVGYFFLDTASVPSSEIFERLKKLGRIKEK